MSIALKERPYWSDTIDFPSFTLQDNLPEQIDVAIVGGGYTGLAAARELAKRGASVIVFESHHFGWGASSRNGGQVLTGTKLSASGLVKRFGKEKARDMFCSSLDCIAYVERVVREESIDCGFARCGHIELAYKPSHFEGFQHEADLIGRDFEHPITLIPKSELRDEIASEAYHGGMLDEASACVNPAQYVVGLANAAHRAGASLVEQTQVVKISPRTKTSRAVVETTRGRVRANEVMIATNGYTTNLVPFLHRRMIPIGSYIIATEPLESALAESLIPKKRMMYDSKNFLYYFRLSDDNRMIFGGRAEFVPPNENSTRDSAKVLREGMIQVFPQLENAKVEYAWGGTLGFTFDLLPHAGVTKDGIHYALGCGGHGVAMLSYLGACVAQRIAGDTTHNPTFSLPFPGAPLGLYNGTPWFLPFAEMYYRALDRIR
jgi:glycine/D-amino acid oxidase-like deaminating enzyme